MGRIVLRFVCLVVIRRVGIHAFLRVVLRGEGFVFWVSDVVVEWLLRWTSVLEILFSQLLILKHAELHHSVGVGSSVLFLWSDGIRGFSRAEVFVTVSSFSDSNFLMQMLDFLLKLFFHF